MMIGQGRMACLDEPYNDVSRMQQPGADRTPRAIVLISLRWVQKYTIYPPVDRI